MRAGFRVIFGDSYRSAKIQSFRSFVRRRLSTTLSARMTIKDVHRCLFSSMKERKCQGGELNSRPRAYESPALPLSYPGFVRMVKIPILYKESSNNP